jgi:hypothetical protein
MHVVNTALCLQHPQHVNKRIPLVPSKGSAADVVRQPEQRLQKGDGQPKLKALLTAKSTTDLDKAVNSAYVQN